MKCNICNKPMVFRGDWYVCTRCGLKRVKFNFDYKGLYRKSYVIKQPWWRKLYHRFPFLMSYFNHKVKILMKKSFLKEIPKNAKVLDVGCSDGLLLEWLNYKGFKSLHGVEPTTASVNNSRLSHLIQNIGFMEYRTKKKYDVVFCLAVLEHIDDTNRFLKKINALLKPKGILILQVPNKRDKYDYRHINVFNPYCLGELLRNNGFVITKFYEPKKKKQYYLKAQKVRRKAEQEN